MKTYTLDDLLYFSENGMENRAMAREMQALGIDYEASVAFRFAESTRNRSVVDLYWDYGGTYGAQLETYIESVLKRQPCALRERSAPIPTSYSLGQLAWVHAVGMCQGDIVDEMQRNGTPHDVATKVAASVAASKTLLGMWKECGVEHRLQIERYLASCLKSYTPGWPHESAPAALRAQAAAPTVPNPTSIVDDEGDVPHAIAAFFGADRQSHVRFCLDQEGEINLLGIWREPSDAVTGAGMVAWLARTYARPVRAVEVADSAAGFWEKMQSKGLIVGWSAEPMHKASVPITTKDIGVAKKEKADPVILYSVTCVAKLDAIASEGMRPGSYWANDTDITAYYAETIEDEGEEPVVLRVDLSTLDPQYLVPDLNGIEEPLTHTLGKSEDEIRELWESSGETAQDSLDIIGTARYQAVIHPSLLTVKDEAGNLLTLDQHLESRSSKKTPRP